MKKFLLTFLVSLSLLLFGCTMRESSPSDQALGISQLRQIVAEDNKTSRTIMWQSEAKNNFSVEYRPKGGSSAKSFAKEISFQEANGNYILYETNLQNLKPSTTYEYRIINKDKQGSWHELKTDNSKSFTALIFPDSQSSDYTGWTKLVRTAEKRHTGADFFVNMGDLVDNGQDARQWKAWFESVEPFSPNLALAPVLGNHEAYSLDWKACPPRAFTHLFSLPKNNFSYKYPNQFYSFDYGPVHFTVLDTTFLDEVKATQPQLKDEQLAWLEKDLANAKAKWKVVLSHRDIMMYRFSPESKRPERATFFNNYGKLLMPIYEKYQVDAVLTAHLHTYRRRVPILNFKPDPKGITYILTGVAGNVRYPKLWSTTETWDAALAPQPETANYLTMEANEKQIIFKAYLESGKQFDSLTLSK